MTTNDITDSPYTHPSMPTDGFPKHVVRSPFSPYLRPLPEADAKPFAWPNETQWPSVPATHVTGNLVAGVDPASPGAVVVAELVARQSGKSMAWLEQVCSDPEGRALVQSILDRKAAQA